jgi:hypothetical protein
MKTRVARIVFVILSVGHLVIAQEAAPTAVAGTITGRGTAHHVPVFTGATTIGNSKIFQAPSGNVGIGTTTPAATLDINGAINAATSYKLGGTAFAYGSYTNENVFLGFAGNTTTTNGANTAIGVLALQANTTGGADTATGVYALATNTTGEQNTATGLGALYENTTGNFNTASGVSALTTNTTGSQNTAIGNFAGFTADLSSVTGSYDTAVGSNAYFGTGSISNATAIGSNAEVTESNTLILGCISGVNNCSSNVNVGIGTTTPDNLLTVNGSADKPGGGSWGTYSDGRLKTVNGRFSSGLSQILRIMPVRYRYKEDNAMGIRDVEEHIGVVAQDVRMVIPEAVTESSKGYLLVNNDPIIWSMLNAIKEQQLEIRALKSELQTTRQTLQKVQTQVARTQPAFVAAK